MYHNFKKKKKGKTQTWDSRLKKGQIPVPLPLPQWCQLKGCAALSGLPFFVDLTQASASLLPGLSGACLSGLSNILSSQNVR